MKKRLLFILICLLCISFHSIAQGNLLITPKRVVFEGNKRKELISLVNLGNEATTYSISFVQKNMTEKGSFVTVEKPDSSQMFADPFLRIFPRKVTLAPGESQIIAVQCKRKPDMLEGEYRSHLYFRSEIDYNPLGMSNAAKDEKMLSVQLLPVFGISIPVIIRSGAVNVSAALSDLKLENQEETSQNLSLTINRSGNISLYGNLSVEYIPAHGKPYEIGTVNGVGVYTSINKRNISIKLNNMPGMTHKKGKLKVRYTSPNDSRYVVYAESELDL